MKAFYRNPFTILFIIFSVLLTACDPEEDVVIDEPNDDPATEPNIEYVSFELSLNDYQDIANFYLEENSSADDSAIANYIRTNKYFSDSIPATDYIPYLLKHTYSNAAPQSKAKITHNYLEGGETANLSKYTDADNLAIDSVQYADISPETALTQYFYPEKPSDEHLPGILNETVNNPHEGDIIMVSFRESETSPYIDTINHTPDPLLEDNFQNQDEFGAFFSYSHTGEQDWYWQPYGDGCLTISGYNGGNTSNENLLISEEVTIPEAQNVVLNFKQAVTYMADAYWNQLKVLITTNFNADNPINSDWQELTVPDMPPGNNWSFYASGDIDLSDYASENIRIAFSYTSSEENACTWEIGEVQIEATTLGPVITGGNPKNKSAFYSYQNNEWTKDESVHLLDDSFYHEEMGWGANYFYQTTDHEMYITEYLNDNNGFAYEGQTRHVIFRKDNGESVVLMGITFIRKNHQWEKAGGTVSLKEENFLVINSDGNWQPDPNEHFTMTSMDYLTIVEAVSNEFGEQYLDNNQAAEYYTGANAYYENFDLRISKRLEYDPETYEGLSEEDAKDEIIRRLATAMQLLLQNKYPDAVSQVNGNPVQYTVEFESYNNDFTRSTWVANMRCVEAGNPPEFELIDNTFLQDGTSVVVPE